ncbi:WD40 repeat-like protein [Paxillus ammoniavirescens]|nr:WD40 repeat-like protein [Paxillus ammoniavirescens]
MPSIGTSVTPGQGVGQRTRLFSRWITPKRTRPPARSSNHINGIWALAFVPGSDLVVSGSHDGTCRVWSTRDSSKMIGDSMFHGWPVYAVVVFGDGRTIASGGSDGKIVVWDLESGRKVRDWSTGQRSVDFLSLSPDGKMLVTGSDRGMLNFWNPSTGKLIAGPLKLHTASIRSVSFSPDGSKIATASFDKTIRVIHNHPGNETIRVFEAHDRPVTSVVWSVDGQRLVSGSVDTTVKFFNSSTGSLLATCRGHTNTVTCIVVSPNGEVVMSASEDTTVRLWSTSTFQQVAMTRRHPCRVWSLALSPDGRYLAGAGSDKRVRIWAVRRRGPPLVTNESESSPASPTRTDHELSLLPRPEASGRHPDTAYPPEYKLVRTRKSMFRRARQGPRSGVSS